MWKMIVRYNYDEAVVRTKQKFQLKKMFYLR